MSSSSSSSVSSSSQQDPWTLQYYSKDVDDTKRRIAKFSRLAADLNEENEDQLDDEEQQRIAKIKSTFSKTLCSLNLCMKLMQQGEIDNETALDRLNKLEKRVLPQLNCFNEHIRKEWKSKISLLQKKAEMGRKVDELLKADPQLFEAIAKRKIKENKKKRSREEAGLNADRASGSKKPKPSSDSSSDDEATRRSERVATLQAITSSRLDPLRAAKQTNGANGN